MSTINIFKTDIYLFSCKQKTWKNIYANKFCKDFASLILLYYNVVYHPVT